MEDGLLICPKDNKKYYKITCKKKDCCIQNGCNVEISRTHKAKATKADTESSVPVKLSDLSITRYIPSDRLKVLIDLYHILETNMEPTKAANPLKNTASKFLIYELYHLLLLSKYENYISQPYDKYIELQPKNIISALKKDLKVQGVDKDTLLHLKAGDTEPSKDRWTFSGEIAEVLIFLGLAQKDEGYYHPLNNSIKKIITAAPDDIKEHLIYKPVYEILSKPQALEALTQRCKTNKKGDQNELLILEPLCQYVPGFYTYIKQPVFYRKSKIEKAQKLRTIFEENPLLSYEVPKDGQHNHHQDRLCNHPEKDSSWIYRYAIKRELTKNKKPK